MNARQTGTTGAVDQVATTLDKLYQPSGFLVARSPLLPFSELEAWADGVVPTEAGDLRSYSACREALVARLSKVFERSELKEALFFASPALERRVDVWLRDHQSDPGLARVLTAYFTRVTSRETPFGTFAGVTLGEVGAHTRLELGARATYARHTRVGMGYLVEELTQLGQRQAVRERLRYEPNSALHEAFGRLRFAEIDVVREPAEAESYPVVDVAPTPHLLRALARARQGATLDEIAAAIDTPGVGREAAQTFSSALVEHGILVPSWLPAVSGPEPFRLAQQELSKHSALAAEAKRLGATCERLTALNSGSLGSRVAELRALQHELKPEGTSRSFSQLFQADLIKPGAGLSLAPAQVEQFMRSAELIQRTSMPHRDPRLERFRERFVARYEAQFVPLVEALDPDLGLGFDSFQGSARDAWIDDLVGHRGPATAPVPFTALDQLRLQILAQCLRRGHTVCELDQQTLSLFPQRPLVELPESFAVAAHIARAAGQMRIVCPMLIAPCAVAMMVRFCHADPLLERAIRAHVEREQVLAGSRILADVTHLPNGHVANILLRPVLRSFEIVCSGKSGAPAQQQIPVSDLYVGVQADRVLLRSNRLQKRVSIRITNAHNVDASHHLPLYRFLGALQDSECGSLSAAWSWGALDSSPFLPRVVRGDIVLCRARWTLWKNDLEPLLSPVPENAFKQVQALRERLQLPRWVSLLGSGPLLVDLDNCLSVEMFVHELRGVTLAVLEELLPAPDELALHGPEGHYVSEIVVPFVRNLPVTGRPARALRRPVSGSSPHPTIQRAFLPGSEWLYVKVFTGPSQLDEILHRLSEDVLLSCRGSGVSWFFVPYADPEAHLRLRFRGDPSALLGSVLPGIERAMASSKETGLVWRLQLDTYERELERYGGPVGIELAEELFFADSEAARLLIALCSDDAELRWQLALVGIDRMFGDLGLSLEQRARVASVTAEGYRSEFDATALVKRRIAHQYRGSAKRLGELLWGPHPDASALAESGLAILRGRSRTVVGTCQRLRRAAAMGDLTTDLLSFAGALAHMHAVRMLGLNVRAYELVLYDYLRRQYATRSALGPALPTQEQSLSFQGLRDGDRCE